MPGVHSDQTDSALVHKASRGDANAFGELYDRYFDQMYRYISFRVPTTEEVEDLTETLFLKTMEALHKQDGVIKNFRAWLYRSAQNLVIDHYRTRKDWQSLDEVGQIPDEEPGPEASMELAIQTATVQRAISRLAPDLQQVISCRFINSLSHAETAEIMGLKEGHLRVLQHRALKQLRFYLSTDNKHHE